MQVVIGNKKIKIFFYIFVFIFLSTISFFERTKIFDDKFIFKLKEIKIYGYEKIDPAHIQRELNSMIGQNLFFINSDEIKGVLSANKLIGEFTIQKKYPDTINISLREVGFIARLIKNGQKYLLADNGNLVSSKVYLVDQDLPNIYGKDAEYYFNDFQKLLKSNNFDLDMISSYYFYQINRWDLFLKNEKIIKFPSKDLKEAIKIVKKLLNKEEFNQYSVIDLRIKNQIITQ